MPLEKEDHAAQHAVVAAGHQAQNERQIAEKPEVRAQLQQIGPPHTTKDDEILAACLVKCAQHAADLAEADPSMGVRLDAGLGLACNGNDMHGTAGPANLIHHFQWQPAVARQNAERPAARGHVLALGFARRANGPLAAFPNEGDDLLHQRMVRKFRRNVVDALLQRALGGEQQAVSAP